MVRVEKAQVTVMAAVFFLDLLLVLPLGVTAQEPSGTTRQETKKHRSEAVGVIQGRVTFEGVVPKARVADDAGLRRNLLHVDRKTRGLEYAIAYLVLPAPADKVGRPAKPPEKPFIIDQKDHEFVPHLIAIRSGQTVRFTNSDAANHNVRSTSLVEKNQFNVITGVGDAYRHKFFSDRKIRPVLLSCDIHPWMRSWIYVFDHPYYSVTDTQGRFEIPGITPGKHRLIVRQPDGGFHNERVIEVRAGQRTYLDIRVTRDALKAIRPTEKK